MVTGYGIFSSTETERLLYGELVADLYHVIDAMKKDKNKSRTYWVQELEKVLEQLGTPRPKHRRAGPR